MTPDEQQKLEQITGLTRQQPNTRILLDDAMRNNPEQSAQDIALSDSLGLPLDVVERNRDELQRKQRLNNTNLNGYPATQRFVSDQKNARLSVDDLDNLKATEDLLRPERVGFWDNVAAGTLDRVNTLTGNFLQAFGSLGRDLRETFDEIGLPYPGITVGDDGVSFYYDLPSDTPLMLETAGKAISEGNGYGYEPRFTWERFKGDMDATNLAGYVTEQGIQSLPDMVAAIYTLPAYIASRTEEIAEARVANDERTDVTSGDLATSLVPAVAVSLVERFAAKVTFGKGGVTTPMDALKATGAAAVTEGGTEFIQEGIEYVGETAGTKKEMTLAKMVDRQLAGLVAGAGMGGAIRGATATYEAVASKTARKTEQTIKSVVEQAYIDEFIQFAQSSQLRGLAQDRYADFLRGNNSTREVFITPEGVQAAQEAGIDLPEGITPGEVGADTVMDVATFATQIAPNEDLISVLRPHIRLSSDTLTLNEMEQNQLDLVNMVQRASEDKAVRDEADAIYEEVRDQIVATGRQSDMTARYSAQIIPAYVTVKAQETGLSVREVYERMGLSIVGPATELRTGRTLEQLENEQARAKGLDMSTEARMQRARDMGFDTDTVYYRGQTADVSQMRVNENGVLFVTPDPNYASDPHYGGREGGSVYPLYLSSDLLFDYNDTAAKDALLSKGKSPLFRSAANGDFRALQDPEVTAALKDLGYQGFKALEPEGQPSVAVFDPDQIRSVNAAFDPEFKASPDLLAQGPSPEFEALNIPEATRQVNFDEWFADSKIVDEQGEPLTMFHGTGNIDSIFSGGFDPDLTGQGMDQLGSGFYFTTDSAEAHGYETALTQNLKHDGTKLGGDTSPGTVEVYLSVKNPIVVRGANLNDSDVELTADQVVEILKYSERAKDPEESPFGDFYEEYWSDGTQDWMYEAVADTYEGASLISLENDFFEGEATNFRRALNEVLGYDGVVQEFDNGKRHVVAWFPEQIKSVDNRGTFDPQDPNIFYQSAQGFDPSKLTGQLEDDYLDLVDDHGEDVARERFIADKQEVMSYAMDEAINGSESDARIAKDQIDEILRAGVPVADEVQFQRYKKALAEAGIVDVTDADRRLQFLYRELDYLMGLNPDSLSEVGRRRNENDIARLQAEIAQLEGGTTLFQFAGANAQTAPLADLERAKEMAEGGKSSGAILRETGWFRGVDGRWRFEISDDTARLVGDVTDSQKAAVRPDVEKNAVLSQTGAVIKATYDTDGVYASSFGRTEEEALENLTYNLAAKKTKTLPGGFRGVNGLKPGNVTTVGKILDHELLFKAYPDIASIKVKAIADATPAEYGSYTETENLIELNTNRSDEEVLSTLLHEIQHAIQSREDFARGGSSSPAFTSAVKDALGRVSAGERNAVDRWVSRNEVTIQEADKASDLATKALMYKSSERLIDYANRDKPSSVFRLIRNEAQWLYERTIQGNDELRQKANEIERMFYGIPKRGPKRNEAIRDIAWETSQLLREIVGAETITQFKEDSRTLDGMVKAFEREASRAREKLQPLRDLKKRAEEAETVAEKSRFKSPFEIYRSLAGEIEARATQARQKLTAEERRGRGPAMDYDVPTDEAIVVVGGMEIMAPTSMSSMAQQERGSITFTPNNEAIIRLGKASDLSTFLHESAHLFLEMERKFASEFGVTENQQAMLDYLGVESFDQIETEQHETWARSFEAYAREGRAPSSALREAFYAFRRWLTNIYRRISQLDVKLTDEIRGVFDRLLATDREIAEAMASPQYEELFRSKEQAGMTDEQWEKYQKAAAKRRDATTRTIDEKLLDEWRRRRTREWNEEKAPLVDSHKERLSKLPVYQVLSEARNYPMDHQLLLDLVGVEKLPGKFIGRTRKEGGIDPQEYAEVYGFNNVRQMYNAIVDAPALSKAAEEAAEAEMLNKYGDVLNDGTIEAEVQEAAHNEEQAELLLQELNALKPPRQPDINRDFLKAEAKRLVGSMRYSEIKPHKYSRAEVRAAQNAAKSTVKGDQYQYKIQQLFNHYLYREAVDTREAMIKQRKYIRGVQKREYNSKEIAPEYITNMKLVANMYDMRQKPAQTMAIDQVLTWYETQMTDPNGFAQLQLMDVNLIRALEAKRDGRLAELTLPTFDDLTAEDLRGTYDMLRHLRHVGGQMSDVAKAEFQQEVDGFIASIEQHGGRDVKDLAGLPGKHTDLKRKLTHLINLIPSLRNLVRKLDGFEDGVAYESLYRRVEDAQNKKLDLGAEMYDRFKSELNDIHKIGLSRKDHTTYLLESGASLDVTSEHRFMMALYWGTESSRQAIRDGFGVTDGDVSRILSDMPDEQVDLLNAVWKVNESMWPELSAASVRLTGVAPPKLEPTPFYINGKPLSGGHMRLFYDSSELEMKSEQEDASKMSTIVPSRAGSLYERVGSGGRAPMLDVNNLTRAIEDNVHYIAFAEAGRAIASVMNNNGVKDMMERKHGRGFRKALIQNLENITSNRPAIETLPLIPQVSRLVRHALTMKYLAYSLRNAIQGVALIKTAMDEVGFTPFLGAFTRFVSPGGHQETVSFVQERSAFMRNRSSLINREASEYLRKITITGPAGHAWQMFAAYGFTPQTIVDSFMAYPVWVAKYEASMDAHGDEKRAISEADTAVAESVGSGSDLHLGAALQQNNTEFVKTMTVFGSWFNNYYQRMYRSSRGFSDLRNRETLQALITTPFVIALLSALLIMDYPDGEGEDDEGWWEWAGKRYVGFMAGTVPLLRDINSAFGGFTPKTPLASVAEVPSRLANEIGAAAGDRQTPLKTASDLINLTTTVVPVPGAGNVTRVMNFVDSDMQGNETGNPFAKTYQALIEGPNRN